MVWQTFILHVNVHERWCSYRGIIYVLYANCLLIMRVVPSVRPGIQLLLEMVIFYYICTEMTAIKPIYNTVLQVSTIIFTCSVVTWWCINMWTWIDGVKSSGWNHHESTAFFYLDHIMIRIKKQSFAVLLASLYVLNGSLLHVSISYTCLS